MLHGSRAPSADFQAAEQKDSQGEGRGTKPIAPANDERFSRSLWERNFPIEVKGLVFRTRIGDRPIG